LSIPEGFQELSKVKTLKVIDLSNNQIALPIHEFYNYIVVPLKKLPKLEYLAFVGNPAEESIKEFKLFVINDLTKLRYMDWEMITKEVASSTNVSNILIEKNQIKSTRE
jgi:Leucine-rich repeat (LRR) protein